MKHEHYEMNTRLILWLPTYITAIWIYNHKSHAFKDIKRVPLLNLSVGTEVYKPHFRCTFRWTKHCRRTFACSYVQGWGTPSDSSHSDGKKYSGNEGESAVVDQQMDPNTTVQRYLRSLDVKNKDVVERFLLESQALSKISKNPWDVEEHDLPLPGPLQQMKAVHQLREPFRRHPADCGSSEFQISSLTARIRYLSKHMTLNKKDYSSRRGYEALLHKRKRLLQYLGKTKYKVYLDLINRLRLQPVLIPGHAENYHRSVRYAFFPKSKKKKKQ